MTVALASQILGFFSFSITLLTLLGVYSEMIKTLRSAPRTIPIALGNFREELQYEQMYLRKKLRTPDKFEIFPDVRAAKRQDSDFARLIEQTLRHLWTEFCSLERPFILNGETPWTLQDGSDRGDRDERDEKLQGTRRRRSSRRPPRRESYVKNKMGWVEAGLATNKGTYYNTDLPHRFLWWWKRDAFDSLAQNLQRIQIRRMERDLYEVDELMRRGYSRQCRTYGWDAYDSRSSDDNDDESRWGHGGGDSGSDDGGGRAGHGTNTRRGSIGGTDRRSQRARRRSTRRGSPAKGAREVSERELIRRVARSPQRATRTRSGTAQQNERSRRGSVVYEYEIVNPGNTHVEVQGTRPDRDTQRDRYRSYSRER